MIDLHTKKSELHGRNGRLIMRHWNLAQKLMSNHLGVKRKLKFTHPSHLLTNISHRERTKCLVTIESWYVMNFCFKGKKQAHFSTKKERKDKRISWRSPFPKEKQEVLPEWKLFWNLFKSTPLKKTSLPLSVCSLFRIHPSSSQSQHHSLLPPIIHAHIPVGIMNLIWAMAFIEKNHCMPTCHTSEVQTKTSDSLIWI